ncbi:V-type ATP synthase subunit I [Faecalicatena acetigenes]|uniref:V-type ATP synthase subunit I n=1 Tax=Faecalicatena acetigenes TaxID=2981790 RepID=A0ABT2T8G9_9FIRM|nr:MULTISPECIES: V-type ATP synthase subunit I [Lachnospiraceae]MCU6746217.1 V-type ATP synthase subunit I [Faecalicatena acetigenes]SCH01886.1 V-type ATP synthase subunit I [uncultured Clostridium sp.]
MAVLQMQRISICALKKDRKPILEKLQSMGVIELSQLIEEDQDFHKLDTINARMSFEKAAVSTDGALEILDAYAPVKKSMLSSLEGKDLVEKAAYRQVLDRKEDLLKKVKEIHLLDKEKAEQTANILKLENQIESLKPWLALDVPMDFAGTEKTAMLLGTMPGQTRVEDVLSILADKAPEVEGVEVQIISSEPDTVYMAVLCLKKEEAEAEEALRSAGFAKPSQICADIPAREKEELENKIKSIKIRIGEIEKEVKESASIREELKILADYYRVRADKYEVLGQLPQSERTFVISGYIPRQKVKDVEDFLQAKYDCAVDVEELKEDEEMPVLLKNNPFSASVEGIVESYGLPHKGEIDPTTIMSFFYVFFFGMMLSDAAYGAIVAAACFIVLKKFPRMGESMKKSLKLFMYCGISTLVWGILFGGYFGNIVDIVSEKFFGHAVTVPALWFVPLNDPMKLLVYSMLFGVIHLFVGLGIKGYMCLRDGKVMDFFCDVVLWFMLLTGLILMLLPSDIFASIAQTQIVFPGPVNTIAKVLAIAGAVGIILMSGRSSKNPGIRIALGAYDLYNVTGWLSDALSYSRLLALGLATGVIASVINQMGSMMPNNIFGIIGFVVIFIIGHLLNLAINLLGAYVHTNRLQFVEFFGKFYEGGGKPFHPFRTNTKYTDLKEETLS